MTQYRVLEGGGGTTKSGPDVTACRGCGCEWFHLTEPAVVALDRRRSITGYSGALICDECERPLDADAVNLTVVPT